VYSAVGYWLLCGEETLRESEILPLLRREEVEREERRHPSLSSPRAFCTKNLLWAPIDWGGPLLYMTLPPKNSLFTLSPSLPTLTIAKPKRYTRVKVEHTLFQFTNLLNLTAKKKINVRIVCEYISESLIHVFKEHVHILCICMQSTSSHSRVISLSTLTLPFLLINMIFTFPFSSFLDRFLLID
jgi:hypothetical protein